MIFRESNLEDVEAMARIIQLCQDHHHLKSELDWSKESLQQAMTESSGKVLGSYLALELIGFILFKELPHSADSRDFMVKKPNKKSKNSLEVWCLATEPRHQGMGVMSALLSRLKAMSNEIWLEVHEANTVAINFYKNQRFQQVGLRPNYYKDGKKAVLFTWKEENE